MKRGSRLGMGLVLLAFCAVATFVLAGNAYSSTVHVVLFGGAYGESYFPDNFTASVGDTVRWEGDFLMHPMSSTSVPAGALSWNNTDGTTFDYVITVPGIYYYQCDVHAPYMVASFSAIVAGVNNNSAPEEPRSYQLSQNFPNPFNPTTMIHYQLPAVSDVKLAVYDLLGREVAVLVSGQEAPGNFNVSFDGNGLASGAYVYRLTANPAGGGQTSGFVQSRRMVLAK